MHICILSVELLLTFGIGLICLDISMQTCLLTSIVSSKACTDMRMQYCTYLTLLSWH